MVVAVSNVAIKFCDILKRISLDVKARLSDAMEGKVHDTELICLQGRNNEQSARIMTRLRRDLLPPQGSFNVKKKAEGTSETSPHF